MGLPEAITPAKLPNVGNGSNKFFINESKLKKYDSMLMEMKPNEETQYMVCGGCGHKFSSHKITVNTQNSKLKGKCKVCNCKEISDG